MNVDQHVLEGMGAIVDDKGTGFRVWAPHADKVAVSGDFNEWNDAGNELEHEANGYWYAFIEGAKSGDEYKFVITNGENKLVKADPYGRDVNQENGNSIIPATDFDWSGDGDFQMPAWNHMVIYEMHIGTFSGENGNGTFDGAIEKFEYLRELGINTIELMPVSAFGTPTSMGYNPNHVFAVQKSYGGPEGLKRFVKAAHEHGIAVIHDVVYNHFGPEDLDLWQFDGWTANGDDGGIYFYSDWRKETPWGSRPDYGREEVRRYILDNALLWLEEYHCDGLRLDGLAHIRNADGTHEESKDIAEGWALLSWINKEVKERYPWKITIAEDLKLNGWVTKPEPDGGAGFSSQWDPHFYRPAHDAITVAEDTQVNLEEIESSINYKYNGDAFQRVVYTESHDEIKEGMDRIPEQVQPGEADGWFAKKKSTLGAGLVFSSPGIPMLFQGQEFLCYSHFASEVRLNWSLLEKFGGIKDMYRDLIHLRQNREQNTAGLAGQHIEVTHRNDGDKVLCWHRWDNGGEKDSCVVIANFGNTTHTDYVISLPHPGKWKLYFNSDWKGYDEALGATEVYDTEGFENEGENSGWHGTISIPPYSLLIYALEAAP